MLKERVSRLKGKNALPTENKLATTIIIVMKEMGWSYGTMMDCPIPAFNTILHVLNEKAEREKREYDKIRKKGKK